MTGSVNYDAYYQLVKSSPFEFQELAEHFLVTETWFFRNAAAIDAAVKKVVEAPPGKITRILSLGCSSGEEPYSIAMALLDANVRPQNISITAYDLSKKAIAIALRGLYEKNSFREKNNEFRDRYFTSVGTQYEIVKQIRHLVQFQYGNILNKSLIKLPPSYDIIFCRNVLLYLSQEARNTVLSRIKYVLASDGIIIVTAAETEAVRKLRFVSIAEGPSYVLKKLKSTSSHNKAGQLQDTESSTLNELFKELNDEIDYIRKLADQGEFNKANKQCQAYIDKNLVDAEGHFLLGVIQHALKNNDAAKQAFMKAIYLKPEHHQALIYLSLIEEGMGNTKQANIYRQRADRVGDNH